MHVYYGRGPDPFPGEASKHVVPYRPAPADTEEKVSWHWLADCPWDR